jgi:PhzF family phenazine biosynthesis protein
MQSIARELNNSETAFLLQATSEDHDVWIRYFTPTIEVPICGHATISAHFVRSKELGITSGVVRQKTGAGILPVEIITDNEGPQIVMTQGSIEFGKPFGDSIQTQICSALGIKKTDLDSRCPIQVVSTGHSKVLIGIKQLPNLHALTPDLTELARISGEINCNGFFVFTFESDDPKIFAHGRMFAPAIGISEDPVTGNATGPLGAYVAKHGLLAPDSNGVVSFTARQGEAIGRMGEVLVSVKIKNNLPLEVKIAGRAVTAFQTEIQI